jgi:hypothetical protein
MKTIIILLLIILISSWWFASIAQTPRITFTAPGVYPEGVAYDAPSKRFFVSSETTGTIGAVDLQGNYTVFYEGHDLKSTFGMKVDPKTHTLWVCAGDPMSSRYSTPATHKKQIRLIGLDLASGQKTADVDLSELFPGNHFANDVALDDQGNKYITDSYSPVIYKVDNRNSASVFSKNELFKGTGIGLNGIVWSRQGYLLVINDANGNLLKVNVKDPSVVTEVNISRLFPGGDGLLFTDQGLSVVQNKGVNIISQIVSNDQWKTASFQSATSVTDRFQNPSTLVAVDEKLYALNAKLNELTDSTVPKSKEFSLQLVEFKK